MNTDNSGMNLSAQKPLSVQKAVRQMQMDLATTGVVQAQHLVRVFGDPGVGVSLHLPATASSQSPRSVANTLRLTSFRA